MSKKFMSVNGFSSVPFWVFFQIMETPISTRLFYDRLILHTYYADKVIAGHLNDLKI